jgi:hypothetical protein
MDSELIRKNETKGIKVHYYRYQIKNFCRQAAPFASDLSSIDKRIYLRHGLETKISICKLCGIAP